MSEAPFRALAGEIQLDQCIDRPATFHSESAHGIRESGAVEGVQHHEPLQRLHLVPLKVPDQMPANRHFYPAHLPQRFLHLVFADVVETDFIRRARRVGPMRLCDRYDRHLLPVTAAGCRRSYPGSHIGHTLSKAGKSHNSEI